MSTVGEETQGRYLAGDEVIQEAIRILKARLRSPNAAIESPQAAKNFIALQLAGEENEKFAVLWMDAKHQVIDFQVLFHGTIDGAQIYPRVVVKAGLVQNAAACILAHNHPSGNATPSQADITLTRKLKEALALVEIRLLDHLIVGGTANLQFSSLAELGHC